MNADAFIHMQINFSNFAHARGYRKPKNT